MGFDDTLQCRLNPGCPPFRVSTEEHGSYLEASGPGHGSVQKAQVPQRHPTSIQIHDRLPKIPRIPEECSYRHVTTRMPCREPHPNYDLAPPRLEAERATERGIFRAGPSPAARISRRRDGSLRIEYLPSSMARVRRHHPGYENSCSEITGLIQSTHPTQ